MKKLISRLKWFSWGVVCLLGARIVFHDENPMNYDIKNVVNILITALIIELPRPFFHRVIPKFIEWIQEPYRKDHDKWMGLEYHHEMSERRLKIKYGCVILILFVCLIYIIL